MKLYDITPPITPELAVYPGDTPPRREVLKAIERGDPYTLSTLHATVHLGAHIDGPNHYDADAGGIEGLPLSRFIGPCSVMRLDVGPGHRVTLDDLTGPIDSERLLLHTGTFPDPNHWRDDFAGITPDLIDLFADAGGQLLGIDTPSIDTMSGESLVAHHRCRERSVTILEGLLLDAVPEGTYELIALPLPLVGFDASPVRAILRTP